MRTGTRDSETRRIGISNLTPTTIFSLLANRRRRYALHYLSKRVGAVSLEELAEQIALREDDSTEGQYHRILASLHHHHVPKLTDAGVVRYDSESKTVTLRDEKRQLAPYLKLSVAEDVQ